MELALCIPLVCVVLAGVVQVAIVVRDQLAVQLAARAGARAAAVSADPHTAAARAGTGVGMHAVSVHADGAVVTVTVEHVTATDVPLIGALIPDVTLQASASAAVEPP